MRIDHIDLIRYGHFFQRAIDIPQRQPDFFVIYGDNAAGKSTLLRAISALFFGVPPRTPDVHSCKGPDLRIGATISNSIASFSFRRRKGTIATLLSEGESQIPEDKLGPFLHGLDRMRFEQFFGLDHIRLREGGEELLRGEGEIGSALFQAAGFDLRKLLDALDKETGELFSPRSKSRVIGIALEEYKQARAQMRRLSLSGAAVKEKQSDVERAKASRDALHAEADLLREQLTKLHRIAGNMADVARLQELRTALALLEWVPGLPANARRQRDQAVADLTDATAQIESLTNQVAQRTENIKALPVSAPFQAHAQEIEALNAGTQDYLRGIIDLPKRCGDRNKVIQRAEMEWRTIWHQRPVSDAEQLRSAYAHKAEIHALITEHARLIVGLEQAEQSLCSDRDEHDRLLRELTANAEPRDPATLLASIDQSKRLGDTGEATSRLQSECKRMDAEIARDLKSLSLWSGSDEELESLSMPMPSTVDRYAHDWEELVGRRRDLSSRESSLAVSIREKQAEVERLGLQVSTAGEKELAEARAQRNHFWELIRAFAFDKTLTSEAAQNQSGSCDPLPEVFAQQLRRSDDIADLRFSNAKDVAVHDRLIKEIASANSEQQSVEAELTASETNFNDLRRRWRSEWSSLAAGPLSPTEMKEWIARRQKILDRLEQRRSKEKDLQLIGERAALAAAEICARLREFGCDAVKETDSLSVVQNVAERFARQVEELRRTIRDLRRNLELIDLDRQKGAVAACKRRLSEWAQKWSPLMIGLLLPPVTTPEQVSAALDVLENVFLQLEKGNDLQHRIDRISENSAQFEADAAKLAGAIDSSLTLLKPQQIATSLQERLVETGKADTRRIELENQNASDEATIATCRAKAQAATVTLQRLTELARCQEVQQLEAAIAGAEEKAERQEDYTRIATGLVERNAIPDLKQIEDEASSYELDSLRNDVGRHEERQRELQDQVFKAGTEYGRLQQEYERLEASEDAALQAQTAEDGLAKARPAIAQYLRLRIAAEVLQRAMDSYREKHQGPVLTRASDLFSRLTLGEHDGLTTAFGDDDKPVLVAIRKNKEQVEVTGLSDGTRDQLYLALRLAAIEDHVARVAPCPVILDDVLIHSDDLRASAALQVLAEIAQRTQVLFFTHHSRLADLGLKAGASVIHLQPSAASVVA
jgi:uncharacterized protein YhaN